MIFKNDVLVAFDGFVAGAANGRKRGAGEEMHKRCPGPQITGKKENAFFRFQPA